ncbi:hypothetical protein QJQ45_023454 [Haematococcus lacustris]|nr:hypothetical protein QJQ45_023454 [Haematococcus lacustris]
MAGFIANRLKVLEAELQASQTQHGTDTAASQQREQELQAQIEELQAGLATAHTSNIVQQQQLVEQQQQLEVQQQQLGEQQQQLEEQQQHLEEQQQQVLAAASGAVCAAEQRAALATCNAHALTLQLGLLQHANAVMAGEAVALQQRAAEGDQAAAAIADLEARCQDLEAQCQDLVIECHEQQVECLRLSAAAPPSSPTAPSPCPASQDKRIRLVQNRGPSINVLRRLIADWESKPRTSQHRHNKDELATVRLCHTQVARYSTARYCVEYSLAALRLLVDCNLSFEKVQETIVRSLGLHILPGQQLEDRVPCGMTLRRAMDDICHQAHKHQSGLCAQAGAGAIGFDSKGDNLGIIMQFALPMRYPAPANSPSPTPANPPSPTPANPPSPTITSQPIPARPARVIRRPSRFATDSPLLTPPPPNTPCLPSSLSQGSASASPSTPPIQGPEAASPGGTAAIPGGTAASPGGTAASPGGTAAIPGGTAASPGGTAASPGGGTQALATNKARLGKRQQQAQSKAERVMKRIRCLVSMPSDEQRAAAVAVRDSVTARQQQQQVDSKRLKELEDTARGVYNRFEPPLPALRSKGMTVEELKHLSQKLGVGSVGKNRRQLLERIAEYCKQ